MSYKLVIFDWDGTLMDSQAKIVNCMQQAARQCKVAVPSDSDVKHIIGISLLPAIKQLFRLSDDGEGNALALAIKDAYKKIYIAKDQTPCPMFAGVQTLLETLHNKNIIMAVATGKARRGLQRAWDNTATKSYFAASRTADEAESKPSSDMLLQLLEELNVNATDAIMVGDTSYDMQMARQISMPSVAVTYGVHDQKQLATQQPTYVVNSVAELEAVLLQELD